MTRTLDRESLLGALGQSGEHRDRACKLERARIVDHEGRRRLRQAARGKGDEPSEQEIPGHDAVCKPLHVRIRLRFAPFRLLDEGDDGAQLRRGRARLHPDENLPFFDGGAGEHVIALRTPHRERLARERRLVHRCAPFLDHAVHAHRHAGAHDDEVPFDKRGRLHPLLLRTAHELRRLGDIEQGIYERALAAGPSVFFEPLAEIEKEHGLAGRFGIALQQRHADGRRVEHGHVETRACERAQCGAQKGQVAQERNHRPDRRGEKPATREIRPCEHGKVGNQGARTRAHLRAAFDPRPLHNLPVDRGNMPERPGAAFCSAAIAYGDASDLRIHHDFLDAGLRAQRARENGDVRRTYASIEQNANAPGHLVLDCMKHRITSSPSPRQRTGPLPIPRRLPFLRLAYQAQRPIRQMQARWHSELRQ